MRPVLFSIGSLNFNGYGLMIAIGIILALVVAERRAPKFGLSSDRVYSLGIVCALTGILGAKLMFLITEIPAIIKNPEIVLSYVFSEGFVVYGGIILGILCAILYCRLKKMDFVRYFDLVMPSVALAQCFGRLGCFMAGCCYGRETDAWYGVVFANSPFAPHDVAVIPTQLISSALNLLNFAALCLFARKAKRGQVAALYLLNYSVGRFFIEYLRNDPRGNVGFLSTSQFISLFVFVIGVIMMVVCSKKRTKAE